MWTKIVLWIIQFQKNQTLLTLIFKEKIYDVIFIQSKVTVLFTSESISDSSEVIRVWLLFYCFKLSLTLLSPYFYFCS